MNDPTNLPAWTARERESFFAAIARHRSAALRIALLSNACALALGIVVAVLMSPLFYAVLGLLLDIVNFVVPMPDLFKIVMDNISPIIDSLDAPQAVPPARLAYIGAMAALPGLVVMGCVMLALSRIMREATMSDAGNFQVRVPDPAVLAEQRFGNVVHEMAVAANLQPPRVFIIDSAAANAAAFGEDGAHATIVMSSGMLANFSRGEMQGVAAHLVGSIANGDMAAGTQVATTLSLFGLVARLSEFMSDKEGAVRFLKLLRGALRHGSSTADGELALELTNPFDSTTRGRREVDPGKVDPGKTDPGKSTDKFDWRALLWMPLAGPLLITGFFGGMLSMLLLSPLLAWAWRRRKLLADATAVRLTRDPDTLGEALVKAMAMPTAGAFAPWSAHMSVAHAEPIGAKGMFGSSGAKMFPALEKRIQALVGMGASLTAPTARGSWQRIPAKIKLLIVPLLALCAALLCVVVYLLALVSVALSGMFTWVPAVILDAILR